MLLSSSGSFLGVVAVALSTVPYSISVLAHTTEVHALLQRMLCMIVLLVSDYLFGSLLGAVQIHEYTIDLFPDLAIIF